MSILDDVIPLCVNFPAPSATISKLNDLKLLYPLCDQTLQVIQYMSREGVMSECEVLLFYTRASDWLWNNLDISVAMAELTLYCSKQC